jgi:hypothetical protein
MARPFPSLHELSPSAELLARLQARQRERAESETPAPLKQARDFVQVSRRWAEALDGVSGQVWQVALLLLHLHWKEHGRPIRLSNRASWAAKLSARSKWRGLAELERRHLILVERRPCKAPIVRVFP